MDKKLIFTVLGIVIIIAGALTYVWMRTAEPPSTSSPVPTAENPESEQPTPQPAPQPQLTPGTYIDYSAEAFTSAKGTRLLFFYAPWCPQCRQLDADIKQSTLPDNVTILKVDYDSSQALRQRYGVTIQTTIVKVDADGNKAASYVAYDEPVFRTVKRELLP